jgi:hypothetical protein
MNNREERIKEIAYGLWEQEGRPEGHSERLWHTALAQYEAKEGQARDANKHSAPAVSVLDAGTAKAACTANDALEVLVAALKNEADFYFAPSTSSIERAHIFNAPKIETIAIDEIAGGGLVLRLAGGALKAEPGGATSGFSVRVPDSFERQVSERKVRVRALVRSATSDATRMAISYSTNEVGNSGWQWREVGPAWSICDIEWGVPKMKNGKGDFIGLLPNQPGAPGVQIHSVSATIF